MRTVLGLRGESGICLNDLVFWGRETSRGVFCWKEFLLLATREREGRRWGGEGRVAKELIFDCRGAGRSGQQAGSLFSQPTLTFECWIHFLSFHWLTIIDQYLYAIILFLVTSLSKLLLVQHRYLRIGYVRPLLHLEHDLYGLEHHTVGRTEQQTTNWSFAILSDPKFPSCTAVHSQYVAITAKLENKSHPSEKLPESGQLLSNLPWVTNLFHCLAPQNPAHLHHSNGTFT